MGNLGRSLSLISFVILISTTSAFADRCGEVIGSPYFESRLKFNSAVESDGGETAAFVLEEFYKTYLQDLAQKGALPLEKVPALSRRMMLTVKEMALNAAHAGNGDSPEKFFLTIYKATAEQVAVTISDESGRFFDGLDPNERVNQLGLRARTSKESEDWESLMSRREKENHEAWRFFSGGRGILMAEEFSSSIRYQPNRDESGEMIGTTVVLTFKPLELELKASGFPEP